MSVKSIKRVLRNKVVEHFSDQMSTVIGDVQVVSAFAGAVLREQHIRVSTPQATPQIEGVANLGRWDVTVSITAVSQIDDFDEDQHDNLVGAIEAYILQGNRVLAGLLTNDDIAVVNVMPSDSSEVSQDSLLYSTQQLTCECYLK